MKDPINTKKVALLILDGWGVSVQPEKSAIFAANTPHMDAYLADYPNAQLLTHGEDVGLPEGQMGNSEVGHINIGAGRVVYQELVRINRAIRTGEIFQSETFQAMIAHALQKDRPLHILGLVSDGGVHSHLDHLLGLCHYLKNIDGLRVSIHAFLDGRDTDPKSGLGYLTLLSDSIRDTNIHIASVIGRYDAMDRDHRWERTKKAYDLLVHGAGEEHADILSAVTNAYERGVTDEFMSAITNANVVSTDRVIQAGDAVLFFNFRTDRPRQLTTVLTQRDMPEFGMHRLDLKFVTFSRYDDSYTGVEVLFEKEGLKNTLGEILAAHQKTQVRIAETEKYPHVTFFFNGGREAVYEGEHRIMIPSPKVATYDLQPEMSARGITEAISAYVKEASPDFICLNYANSDMVGHTGVWSAAVAAAECVDQCLGDLIPLLQEAGYQVLIIADHGNSDYLINDDGSPNTAHTTNPVPIVLVHQPGFGPVRLASGRLADVAPTILELLDLPKPADMDGRSLIQVA